MSPRAASRLETLGFEQVYDYVAGKADWGSGGLPLEGENGSETLRAPMFGPAFRPVVPRNPFRRCASSSRREAGTPASSSTHGRRRRPARTAGHSGQDERFGRGGDDVWAEHGQAERAARKRWSNGCNARTEQSAR